jgi:hypothetical protein
MAELKFYGNIKGAGVSADGELINHSAGSGLGFYGLGFGVSVPIDTRQKTTYITDAIGTASGSQLNNTEMILEGDVNTVGRVKIQNASDLDLDRLPNYQCPLNIRFEHTEPVAVQTCKLRIFDRNNIDNHASGVTTYVFEARHPTTDTAQTNLALRGRTENSWFVYTSGIAMVDMPFTSSPGTSGTNTSVNDVQAPLKGWITASGDSFRAMRHDWYVAISAEPDTIGSKTQYGLYFTLEYL